MVAINGQPNPGLVKVRWGESATCTFIADPNAGKAIDHVSIDGQNAGNITTWTFNSVKENHAVDLVTKWIYFTVSEAHESGGQVFIDGQMNPGSVQVRWGEAVTFNFDTNSNSGKEIRNVIMDGKSLGAVKTFRIDSVKENHTCQLQTQWIYFTIQVTYGLNGHIEPGTSLVKYGDSISFAMVPDNRYMVDKVYVDSSAVGPLNQYNFSLVKANHTLHCTFKLIPLPKYDVTYGGYDFAWRDTNLVPNQGSGGGGPVLTVKIEEGQVFEYTYPATVKDPTLPPEKQFDIPFLYVTINGVKSSSRQIRIPITGTTTIRAYYYIDRTQ